MPVIASAKEFADMGIIPEGSYKNREFAKHFVSKEADIVLFDAQTSGGLLLAVSENDANLALKHLREAGYERSAIIAQTVQKGEFDIFLN